MNKQQTIHRLAGGYSIGSLPGSKSWAGSQYNRTSLLAIFPKILAFAFFAFFMVSFSSGFGSACTSIITHKKEAPPKPLPATPLGQEFSFEYSGLFHFKVVVKRAAHTGILLFTDMDITTSSQF